MICLYKEKKIHDINNLYNVKERNRENNHQKIVTLFYELLAAYSGTQSVFEHFKQHFF